MIQSTMLKLVAQNGKKIFMSTSVRSDVVEGVLEPKRLEHYRHLNALDNADVKPAGWDEAKPFNTIPGPTPLPLIGNVWRFMLPFGTFYGMDFLDVHKKMHREYGDIAILKGMLTQEPMLMLFNVQDIEKLHRNEGVWPIRHVVESFQYYRKSRSDIFKNPGLLTHQGEGWFKFRSMVNPILMQPRNVLQYVDQMNHVADEFVENINYFSKQNSEGEMPEDFNNDIYKWSLESIGVVTMDKHLGCLKRNLDKNSEPQQIIQHVLELFALMYKLDFMPSLWKYVSTRNWRRYVEILNFLSETNLKYVNQYFDKVNNEQIGQESEETNVLQKMLKIDRDVAIAMAVDMMIAGVDTTGRIFAANLYYLAKNPEVQEKLRNEAFTLLPTKDTPVTKETLAKAAYLKAVIKETTRLRPIGLGNLRTTVKNLVMGGYQVPKGTSVMSANVVLSHMDKHYPRATEFLPERWLSTTTGELSHKNTNPFLFAPFGYGPRSCVGKRLANLEIEVALLKVIRNFEVKWPHEDMLFKTTTMHGVASPLKFHMKPIDN